MGGEMLSSRWHVGLAVVAGLCLGSLLRRWAQGYAARLAAGAAASAPTLWAAALTAPRQPWAWRTDGAMALLLGLAAGLLAETGHTRLLVPLAGLTALAWIDARSGLLPDALTLPLMGAGWLWGAQRLDPAIVASLLVWGGLAVLSALYRRVRGHEGFGGGDVKCLAAVAGWFGLAAAGCVLWLACVLGVAACVLQRGGWRQSAPFGPYLALAAALWMLWPAVARLAVQS